MQFKIPHKRSLLTTAITLSLLPLSGVSVAQEVDSIEEVVVTGSFIRRSEGFTQASQTTQITSDDLAAQGTLNLGEVVQNLSFVNGAASAVTNTIQGTSSRTSSIDLRGLGARSTLTLLDGKRLVNQNVNTLIPTIAIQRIDIVADGAAALYGSEAVAGVVNFVPYKSYEGLKVDTYAEQDSRGDYDEHNAQVMWGGSVGDLDVVVAGQFRQASRLGWDERNLLANSGLTFSSNAPGNWRVPVRDANGAYVGSNPTTDYVSDIDPACEAQGRTDFEVDVANNPNGFVLGGQCRFDYGDTRSYRDPLESNQFYANATWDVSDDLTLSMQGFRTKLFQTEYSSTSNPGESRIGELGAVRGEIPGNPFPAVDATGNALYGVDNNNDGIFDRQPGVDVNGDGWDDAIVVGTTANGVPIYEDVVARSLRPINKTHRPSAGHSPDMDNLSQSTDHISRFSFQADFTVPFIEGWEGMAAYSRSRRDFNFVSNQNYDIEAMKQGLRCDVVNDREACYNPFFVTDQANQNSLQVMDAIAARDLETEIDDLDVLDIVLNGELPLGGFELPGGPISAAVGYQLRSDKYTNVPSAVEIAGDTWIGSPVGENITVGSREVDSYFAEFAVPILSNLEFTTAVRREEFSTGESSTDPKFGLTYAPTDWLSLRATMGDAFIAPTLQQKLDPVTCGLDDVSDQFSAFSAFVTVCGGGNPNLGNETSESKQLGFDLVFGDFDLSVTWNNTDFQNRIVGLQPQEKLVTDYANFVAATGFSGSGFPSDAEITAWIANPLSDKDIIRSAADPTNVLQINGLFDYNAENVDVTAWDIQANYSHSLDNIGDFRVGLQATYIDEFLFQGDSSTPLRDGVGRYNDGNGAAPALPQLKANLNISWVNGNHSISTITRYIDDMVFDSPLAGLGFLINAAGGTYHNQASVDEGIKAWTQMDASYTYRGLNLWDGDMSFTLGSRNLFDREAQRTPALAGVIGELQDPMARVFYARAVYEF